MQMAFRKKAVKKTKYTTVHIPNGLVALIDNLIENEGFAYTSRSEFVKDGIRRFLEYHGYYPKSGLTLEKTTIALTPSMLNEGKDEMLEDLNTKINMLQNLRNVLIQNNRKR